MFAFTMLMSVCVDVMVMSSASVVSFTGACGVGSIICVYVEECGTPSVNWRCVDVLFLNVLYALRHLM